MELLIITWGFFCIPEDILDTLLDMSGDPDIDPEPEDAGGE